MRLFTTCVLFVAVVCTFYGEAASIDNYALEPLKQSANGTDVFANTKKLIEDLVANLRAAAQQAADAMAVFAAGLKEQVRLSQEKLYIEIEKLKEKVSLAIKNVSNRFSNASSAVKECIESNKKKTDILFNDAIYKTMNCADGKVQEVGELISRQVEISKGGLEFANKAIEEMWNCTDNDNSVLAKGGCLVSVALKTEMKGAVYLTQSGISIARIDLALGTLPVALEMCAGRRLVEAGMGTAKIIMELGGCSASSVFNTLTGSKLPAINVPIPTNLPNANEMQSGNSANAEINQPVSE
ncbi:uncharacterized protein [Choristoneura fumiferana]|uniref:uncharacterized protein n=1 Tax=Choristoneura fumiferana TaxID=7141 RepID=UPI003D15493A